MERILSLIIIEYRAGYGIMGGHGANAEGFEGSGCGEVVSTAFSVLVADACASN